MSKIWKIILTILLLGTVTTWLSVFSISSSKLKVITCNVGQGDATLIVYKGLDVLIDGGPDGKSVMKCLSNHMPFWDRTLEVVILTHPQADHYGGLIEVFERFKVRKFLANSINASSQSYGLLNNQVLAGGVEVVNPTAGISVRGHLIQLDILHPSREFLSENLTDNLLVNEFNSSLGVLGASDSKLDPNEFSIITLLTFGSFKFLFTGDAGTEILDDLATTLEENGHESINYIKIPHHGSKYSISEKMYDLIKNSVVEGCQSDPELTEGEESPLQYTIYNIQNTGCFSPLAVISVGKNSYGHPSEEVIKQLSDKAIKILRTDMQGDIVF